MTFSDLNISGSLTTALDKLGYTRPTPIQLQAIPHILQGRDVFGSAQTGTGKTAAFSLPILQLLSTLKAKHNNAKIEALILAPTRELASQIGDAIESYSTGV